MGYASNSNFVNDVIGNDSCYQTKWDRNDIMRQLIRELNLVAT